jgi:hypothetical protein
MNVPVTKNTLARLIVLTLGGLAFAMVMPAYADPYAAAFVPAIAAILAATLLVLIAQATVRRHQLFEAVRMELNKLRRLYHISKNLSVAAPQRYRSWFTELHGFLYEYLSLFSGKDFDTYDSSNAHFRKLSYHVYTIPEIESKKEEALFNDLLGTAATVASARQQIKELWDNRLSGYVWTVLMLMVGGFVAAVIFSMGESVGGRLAAGVAVSCVLLAVDLLWEFDTLAAERVQMATRYVNNLGKLELGRRE